MIVDFDDFHAHNHGLDLLEDLHAANPKFRCTLFAVPGLGQPHFWNIVPEWCQLAVHGWIHPDPYECNEWTATRMLDLMGDVERQNKKILGREGFIDGFKAPGWQISDGCYEALLHEDWWVADQHYNDQRRPHGLRVHLLEPPEGESVGLRQGGHWHGHIQNDCGNGLHETFTELLELVKSADDFQLMSEAVKRW